MAKLILSSLVTSIHKSLGGSTFKGHKAGTIIRSRRKPCNPRTADQQLLRGITNRLAGMYYSLSIEQKELWNKYASMLNRPLTGFNAFCGLNARLLKTEHADLNIIYAPPPYPSTPESVIGHSLLKISETTMRYDWLSPQTQDNYVYLEWATQVGYDMTGKETWHKVDVVRSDQGYIEWENNYGLEIPIHTRARTIDKQGRVSPWTAFNPWEHGIPAPIDANTMLYLPMNEGIGSKAMDHSGHINNGTIYGASWTTGIEKYALSFDGIDDYVNCGSGVSLNMTAALGISIHVNPNTGYGETNARIISHDESTRWYVYVVDATKNVRMYLYTTAGVIAVNTSSPLPIGISTNLAFTFDGDYLRLFINGILEDTSVKKTGSIPTTNRILAIASNYSGGTNFNGTIDEVRIYNRALSPNEIYDHYSRLKPL